MPSRTIKLKVHPILGSDTEPISCNSGQSMQSIVVVVLKIPVAAGLIVFSRLIAGRRRAAIARKEPSPTAQESLDLIGIRTSAIQVSKNY